MSFMYMIDDINRNLDIIEKSINWAIKYKKDSFPYEVFKNYRRKLKRIGNAISENCSAAAYGESQVGKSYLMSSLLSTPSNPFVIINKEQGQEKKYSFIDEINPSGGNNTKQESTGVITRFTIRHSNERMADYVKITNLSIVDIILLLTDSYYNDVKINTERSLTNTDIDGQLNQMSDLWLNKENEHNFISEDDIKDICDYIYDVIGNNAQNINKSSFAKTISPVIKYISQDKWVNVFGLLWNNNRELNKLFNALIQEYLKLNFRTNVYVPFDAILREKGTLLKIDWLDYVCGKSEKENNEDIPTTDVYDESGNKIAENFSKTYLSALIGELTFVLPETIADERPFLKKIDLLDFPGARSREKIDENQLSEVLPTILRRGKVAYLFNKYSRSYKISSLLFCHHNDQKTESTLGSSINDWISGNIAETSQGRSEMLQKTKGISPLFMVCTKFNIDLERTKNDISEKLSNHWSRFDTTIPKIIEPKTWFENWVEEGGIFSSTHFQNIYLLRDFYWSKKNQVFDGYDDKMGTIETSLHEYADYLDYFSDLKKDFLSNSFVKKHFSNPEQAWNDVATINNDGSKPIIKNLSEIAEVLDTARRERYYKELVEIRNNINDQLELYYESDDIEQKNEKIRKITGDIKLTTECEFGKKPELFGQIIDSLMIASSSIRSIVYDIIVRHTEVPRSVSSITMIRASAGIDINDDRNTNIKKLSSRYSKTKEELESWFLAQGITLDDVVSDSSELLATVPDVITKNIIEKWKNHINERVQKLKEIIPHSDEIAFMLMSLFDKMGLKNSISTKIADYYNRFDHNELPNVISDYASLVLNNFVSNIGMDYFSERDMETISQKANSCGIKLDISSLRNAPSESQQSLRDVLSDLDNYKKEINNSSININALKSIPFWSNYQRWEKLMTIGFLHVNDISNIDPIANSEMKSILDSSLTLYSNTK